MLALIIDLFIKAYNRDSKYIEFTGPNISPNRDVLSDP